MELALLDPVRGAGRAGAPGAAFDLVTSKLLRPLVRPGTICRFSLIERLAGGGLCRIVSVVAPPGYGKATLVSRWAERNGRAIGWVPIDGADNDPKVLLTYIAAGLDAVQPVAVRVSARWPPGEFRARLGRPAAGLSLSICQMPSATFPGR